MSVVHPGPTVLHAPTLQPHAVLIVLRQRAAIHQLDAVADERERHVLDPGDAMHHRWGTIDLCSWLCVHPRSAVLHHARLQPQSQ